MTIREMNYPFDIGMKKMIKNRGLKQAHIAKQAGYTAQELSDMLNGRRIIKACDIPKLAKALNTKYDDIYTAGLGGD